MDTYTIQLEIKSLVTKEVKKITIETGRVKAVESLLDLGMRHEEQIRQKKYAVHKEYNKIGKGENAKVSCLLPAISMLSATSTKMAACVI